MKKIIAIVMAVSLLLLGGCASLRLTPEEKAQMAAQIQENLDNRTFEIDVDHMNPRRGMSQSVTNYSIKIDGDKIVSHLPYIGAAWNLPYGGGKGLSFEAKISDYIETFPKPDRRVVVLATNNGEDYLVYTMEIFNNGRANIDLRTRNREPISYMGNVLPERPKSSEGKD
ncbi:MAG: DUF4251 domain-containing protein [Bacteroidales bacterium]|nr:DUF4251 domain-containing protein [Bacteroidales bacterium]